MTPHRLFLPIVCLLISVSAFAQTPAVAKHSDPPPSELADAVKAALASGGQTVTIGAKTLQFWWVSSLALTGADAGWASVAEGSLVGVVRLSAGHNEIRGKTIKPGVYTLRLGLQPADGNHLGTTPNPEFLLIAPAAVDKSAAPLGHDGAIKEAMETAGSHPASWLINPPVSTAAPMSTYKNELGLTGIVFEVPTAKGTLRFGLILVGDIQS
jgi:hypothetical protein